MNPAKIHPSEDNLSEMPLLNRILGTTAATILILWWGIHLNSLIQSVGHGHSWLAFSWSALRRSRMDDGQDLYHPKVGPFCVDGLRFCCARGSLFPCGSPSPADERVWI